MVLYSLFTWSKQKWLFWRAGFYPANQRFLKSLQIDLIGWIKVGPPKKPLLFWSCKRPIVISDWNFIFILFSFEAKLNSIESSFHDMNRVKRDINELNLDHNLKKRSSDQQEVWLALFDLNFNSFQWKQIRQKTYTIFQVITILKKYQIILKEICSLLCLLSVSVHKLFKSLLRLFICRFFFKNCCSLKGRIHFVVL